MPRRNPEVYAEVYIPSPSSFLGMALRVEEALEDAFQIHGRGRWGSPERLDFEQVKDAYVRLQYLRIKADVAAATGHPYSEAVLARLESIGRKLSRLGSTLDKMRLRLYVRAEEP
jgi:hypothetical protein